MLNKLKKSNSEGFTIIEVMIVLAIAGLILLIVFLAIPALQRNSRNTQRSNDVGALVGAISEFTNNNNGVGPATQANVDTVTASAKLGILTPANVFYQGTQASAPTVVSAVSSTPSATVLTTDSAIVIKGATCNGNASAAGSTRSYVVLFAVEAASGNGTMRCTQS